MKRSDLVELHFIAPIANVLSILEGGILCHNRARTLEHDSLAMPEIQAKRSKRRVPGGLALHEYVNVYLCARNPMLYKLSGRHRDIAVLRLSTEVLDLPDVVITDGNAASDYTAFYPSPEGLRHIPADLVFAEYWTDQDVFEYWRKKRIKCAEVLVPGVIEPRFITGAYVSCQESERGIRAIGAGLPVSIDASLFFRN